MKVRHHWQLSLAAVTHHLLQFPGALLEMAALRIWPYQMQHGIAVMDVNPRTREQFGLVIAIALNLIRVNDPRCFARVQREIRAIMHIPSRNGGQYTRLTKVCTIDLRPFSLVSDQELRMQLVACTIVFLATGGYFCRHGVFPTRRNHPRLEHACYAETVRFGKRIGLENSPWDSPPEARDTLIVKLRFAWNEIRDLWKHS